jgi:vesicle-fusing ATPase
MVTLQVGNLPSNRLALTNRVYISPNTLKGLVAQRGAPEVMGSGKLFLVNVGPHPYAVDAHHAVPDDTIALNGLQRRFAQLTLAARVPVEPFVPPPNFALAALTLTVDMLAKKATGSGPKPIDTDRLAVDVLNAFEGQVFELDRSLAMDFEGIKLEIRVKDVQQIDLATQSGKRGSSAPEVEMTMYDSPSSNTMGQLLGPTEITFAKAEKSNLVRLTGKHVEAGSAGAGGSANIFRKDFDFEKLGIGGLNAEFNEIFRRAFASRIWPAHIIQQMGINHVRGMLLFGPPGCGKTLIARQIGKVLNAREPKIVNGPEILNKFVGGSEEKIRELFAEAEKEQKEMGDQSMLHIIILDEMDAICKSRGSVRDGTGVSDSVVNQLLSKIDGVDSLNNILLIGMTNRKDMIDDALLRPGRLEVHVEIGLPDAKGRIQVLNIHTKNMRESKPRRITQEVIDRIEELAEKTKNFSGAELEGLVKAASSYALTRCVDVKDLSKPPDEDKLMLQFADFVRALGDVEPKFGAKSNELKAIYRNGFVTYGESFDMLMSTMQRLVDQVRVSEKTPLMSVMLSGQPFSGKSAVAAKVAVESGFPFVRMISADEMIGYTELSKCQTIHKAFLDSYKSPLSLIFIDDIERIIDYVHIGPRFSNLVLQTLLVLLKKIPPDDGRRLFVIGTTSIPHLLEDLGLMQAFSLVQNVNLLDDPNQIKLVLTANAHMGERDAAGIAKAITRPIGIKQLLLVAEMAKQGGKNESVDVNTFLECLHTVGY